MKTIQGLFIFLLISTMSACGGSGPDPSPTKKLGSFHLAQSCEEIQAYVQDFAKRSQQAPGGIVSVRSDGFSTGVASSAPQAAEADNNTGGGGVTQSDIAYPDTARGLLFTASFEKKLKIFRVNPSSQLQMTATLALDFFPSELVSLRSGTREFLIVFGSTGGFYGIGPEPLPAAEIAIAPQEYEEPKMVMAAFDVTDPAQPFEVKRETAPGSFLEARALPGKSAVLWVTQRWVPLYPEVVDPAQIFPEKTVNVSGATAKAPIAACADTYLYQNETLDPAYSPFSLNETVVSLMLLADPALPVSSQAIFSSGWRTVLSANPEHLFLAQNIDLSGRPDTELFQFQLFAGDKPLSFSASGTVPGNILNQFFIDESKGIVRVFHHQQDSFGGCLDCVVGGAPGETGVATAALKNQETLATGNYLSTYQQSGDQLLKLGRTGPFETDEIPYAARFMGEIGCVITFLQIDPLTCFSLKDPANPSKLGELQIAGVSFHLEAITDGLLLGIGRGEGNGSVVANLFDISNPSHPVLAAQKTLASSQDFAYSPVFNDYRALGKDALKRNFAVPIDDMSGSSLALFSVSPESRSINPLGAIQKNSPPETYDSYQRAYFFSDTLAAVSLLEMEVFLRSDLSEVFSAPLN